MENNTSNYAKWVPEAGGYVHNGSVVSKTPVYNDTGRLIDLDMSSLSTPGIQANQANSGIDVNANLTQTGSLGTLDTNTPNPGLGTINTPATNSNVAGQTVLSPIDQVNKDYEYMVATNNIKGQIDKLTQLSQMTGVDYSQTINDLWNQRSQKIKNEDSAYTQAIAQAKQAGDENLAQELMTKQQLYRDNVGYYDQMGRDLQNQQDSLYMDYQTTYMQGISDITNGIMSQLNALINFQYSPQTDLKLQVAQGYAVGAVKEQMNHTGMYYSSMTQSAIARAVAELVPVYEEMARDEIKENISLLQNVGNYLMNLEQMQLSIWEAQLNMKIKANAEKRAQINQAIENANARGYYTNEEAVLLGVPAGTESHEARIRAEDKQDEIEKEQRQLQNQMTLAKYNKELQLQLTQAEYALKYQYSNSGSSSISEPTIELEVETPSGTAKIKGTASQLRAQGYDIGGSNNSQPKTIVGYDENGNPLYNMSEGYSETTQNSINNMKEEGEYDEAKVKRELSSSSFKDLPYDDKHDAIADVQGNYYKEKIIELAKDFSNSYGKTTKAVKNASKLIEEFANLENEAGISIIDQRNDVNDLYETLFNEIDNAKDFDYTWGDVGNGERLKKNSKAYAKSDVVKFMKESDNSLLKNLAEYYQGYKSDADTLWATNTYTGKVLTGIGEMVKNDWNDLNDNLLGPMADSIFGKGTTLKDEAELKKSYESQNAK